MINSRKQIHHENVQSALPSPQLSILSCSFQLDSVLWCFSQIDFPLCHSIQYCCIDFSLSVECTRHSGHADGFIQYLEWISGGIS